ncbi:MAG: DUF1851 domain-containing protein [Planctomycetota bacterium]|nr:DUF1851 domain-containing protein [Planctomycetota bacterium]MDA0932538.1 DUF1851 domain-containing protein [Planctomycetota bacterium]MDA1220766.1 DUF1851 domain-containing protein [Planctomycetota bacterium]
MAITLNDLTISAHGVDMDSILDDWIWAMPEPMRPVLLTALGDAFAQGQSGAVYFVDAASGEIRAVADDGATFQGLLRDARFVTEHMQPARIVAHRRAGLELAAQQVYGRRTPLVLGGADDIDNVEVTDVTVHLSIHGQVHEQVRDLPDGAPISAIRIR